MPERAPTPTPKTYAELRDAVLAVVVKGRAAIDQAWVGTCHETGRLINEHVLLFRERANYGAKTYEKLAVDTGISKRTLQECAQYQRFFPIARSCAQLGWSKCRLLCQVSDAKQREKLRVQTLKNDWRAEDLEARVRAFNAVAIESGETKADEPVELLTSQRGTPGLHPVVERPGGLAIDLGFKFYRDLTGEQQKRLTKGDIVRLDESGVRKIDGATKADLFTYTATVRKVIDGDTLDIAIVVAPGFTRDLKLRLRGLDCPEMSTAAGRAAKLFVDGLIEAGDEIIVCTSKPDKFDRYLADVFLRPAASDKLKAASTGLATPTESSESAAEIFLNNALLAGGYAVRYDGGAKE